MGLIATAWSARALTFPAVPMTSPSAARRRHAAATCSRSRSSIGGHDARRPATTRAREVFLAPARTGAPRAQSRRYCRSLGGAHSPRPTRRTPITDHAISRRRLLGVSAAAGLGTVLERVPGARATGGSRRSADVAVVGAGFAGLTAALRLIEAGRSVVVLEARGRVGGRALNRPIGGDEISECGATFAGPTQDHILALARQFGVGKFPTYDDRKQRLHQQRGDAEHVQRHGPAWNRPTRSGANPGHHPGGHPPRPDVDRGARQRAVASGSARDWDQQTLESWVRANSANPQFRKLVSAATRPIFGAEPRELSLLFVLFYIAASGNEQNAGTFERNFNTRGGAQMWRFVGGSQLLCQKVAHRLGARVVLGSPVQRIVQNGSGVTVHSQDLVVDAKRAIVAIPPTLAGRIDYQPELPAVRDQLTQRLPQGTLIKAAAVYDTAFWRDAGLNGTAISIPGPVNATFDDSPPDGTPGVVFGFIGGDNARSHMAKSAGRPEGGRGQPVREVLRRQGRSPALLLRDQLEPRGMDPRLPGGDRRTRHAAGLRPGAPQARRSHPLGRNGDVDLLERLHGWRRPVRRAGVARGPRPALRRGAPAAFATLAAAAAPCWLPGQRRAGAKVGKRAPRGRAVTTGRARPPPAQKELSALVPQVRGVGGGRWRPGSKGFPRPGLRRSA